MASPKSSVLKDVDLERPILKGYMYKQAHLHKSFNKRYFALYHNVLVYYNSEHEYRRDLERGTLEVSKMWYEILRYASMEHLSQIT